MPKVVLVAAVVAALLAVIVVTEGEAAELAAPFRSAQTQCQREVEQSALDACQQVMHNVAYKVPGQMLRWSPGLHVRCCQQLLGVRRECRHAAIRGLVRKYEVPLAEGSGETVEQQGWYGQTAHRHQQEGRGFPGKSKAHRRHRVEGHESSYGSPGQHTTVGQRGQQPAAGHEFGEIARQQEGQGYGLPSAPRFSTEQQAARLRLMKARHFAARLPVTCRFDAARGRGASSARLY